MRRSATLQPSPNVTQEAQVGQTTSPLDDAAADRWDWPDELDAVVAAPGNHQVLLENDRVRVIRTTVAIGASTPVRTHRWPSVEYVLSATAFVRGDASGSVVFDSRTAEASLHASEALLSDPFPPHSVENVGGEELRVIMVELKRRRTPACKRRPCSRHGHVLSALVAMFSPRYVAAVAV